MITICHECENEYEEKDPENAIFIENDCPMICYQCAKKYWQLSNGNHLMSG